MNRPPAPRRILWVSCVGEKGGAEVYLLNFLRNIDRARFQFGVALLRPGPLESELRDAGVGTFVLPKHRMRNVVAVGRAILELRSLVRRHDFHLIHGNAFRSHPYSGIAARLAGVPAVWSVHTAEKPCASAELIVQIPVASVTANCPRTAEWFARRHLPVNLIWPPVDIVRLDHRTARDTLALRYGLPADARWIGMAARLQRYKGHVFLLTALAGLPQTTPQVHAVVIGGALFGMEESYLAELRQMAQKLGISDRVHFTGFVPDEDLHGLVDACEVMVHPALDEDFGLIVAESQALAKPVVAFASVGPSAIIEDGVTGRLVPVGDSGKLTAALAETLSLSPEERLCLGRAGRRRIEERFAAPAAARRLERVYDACLDGKPLALDASLQPIASMSAR